MQETIDIIKTKLSQLLRKSLTITITLIAIGFFINFAAQHFEDIPPLQWNATSIIASLSSVILMVFSISIVGVIWKTLLQDHDAYISWKESQIIIAISQFGKYLPGNVAHHIGRVFMAREAGIPVSSTVNTMLLETLWGIGIGTGLAMLALILYIDKQSLGFQLHITPLQLAIFLILLLFIPRWIISYLNKYMPRVSSRLSGGGAIVIPRYRTSFLVAILFLFCFIILGLIIKLQAQWLFNVDEGGVFELTCLFSAAWLAGYLVPGAPGGLGVRESMMILLLSPVLGPGTTIGLGVTLRITTTTGDATAFILGVALKRLELKIRAKRQDAQ
jgi:uncharacterized membrane protein YbhN (UPF0104 family)